MQKLLIAFCVLCFTGCSSGRLSVSPAKKYSPEVLQQDYAVYRHVLEQAHPGLYWYTSRDSMNHFFDWGAAQLTDSLTEPQFRRILSYVTSKINCGHTTVRPSKGYERYSDTARITRIFPLSLKLWDDTCIVSGNLNRRDSILLRGVRVTGINGLSMPVIVDSLFQFLSTDGYNRTHKYQTLSNRGFFGSFYSTIFGYSNLYNIDYTDSLGRSGRTIIRPFIPVRDTTVRRPPPPGTVRPPQPSRRDRKNMRRNAVRLLKIDSSSHVAMMDLQSFGRGYGLKGFYKRSFRALKKNKITHLIIDVRGNGGGSVSNSTAITRYISSAPFKIADTLYAVAKHKKYSRYIQNDFFNRLFITFFTRRKRDGNYHFGYFERHRFKPKKKNHFDGKTYILTGGNSFSATTLFAGALRPQENVTLIGEETGGGAYGNSAWLIPDVTLPKTKIRFRLPLFRLVINKDIPKNGRGIQPEIFSGPTIDAVKKGADYKLDKALELINEDKRK